MNCSPGRVFIVSSNGVGVAGLDFQQFGGGGLGERLAQFQHDVTQVEAEAV